MEGVAFGYARTSGKDNMGGWIMKKLRNKKGTLNLDENGHDYLID